MNICFENGSTLGYELETEKLTNLFGVPDLLSYQKHLVKEAYGKSRVLPHWDIESGMKKEVVSKPSKFNVELDFYEPLESKKETGVEFGHDLYPENYNLFSEKSISARYVCSNCDQELMYNSKDDFRYCPACTEGYKNG
jgi:DNA-directed RNA polymerase subunit RPC12/RpoP